MRDRKATMASLAMGVVALPGGIGTLDEIAEMMTMRKLGLFDGEVVILNTNGYFDHLIEWLDNSCAEGFSYGSPSWKVASTPQEAVEIIINRKKA